MFKSKKVIPIFMILVMFFSLANAKSINAEENNLIPVYAKTKVDLTIKDFIQEGYDEEKIISMFSKHGWIFEDNHMYRTTRLMGGDIEINGVNFKINKDGFVNLNKGNYDTFPKNGNKYLDVSSGEELDTNLRAEKVSITEDKIETTLQSTLEKAIYEKDTQSLSKVNQNSKKILIEENLFELLELMDEKENKYLNISPASRDFNPPPYGTKYEIGDHVHCNRFNGPHSDQIHYSKTKNPVKTMINFNGSDCGVSTEQVTFCRKSDNCNQIGSGSRAACSTFMVYKDSGKNCPKTYHSHTYDYCAFDTERYFSSKWYGY